MSVRSQSVLTTLNFGSFPGKVMFTCGFTFDEVCNELKDQKCSEWLQAWKRCQYLFDNLDCQGFSRTETLTIKNKNYYYHFLHLMKRFDFSDEHHTYLSHEAIHLCTHRLDKTLDIVKENEAFAYTHTHILNQCYSILRTKNKLKPLPVKKKNK